MNTYLIRLSALIVALVLNLSVHAQNDALVIEKNAEGRVIPITLEGFTGEAESAIRFDLEVQGFEVVSSDRAQYQVRGSNNGSLTGQVTDRVSRAVVLPATAYNGGTTRSQAHAFTADVVEKITGKRGISQSKIACKVDYGTHAELFVADYDGYNAKPVTSDGALLTAPTWQPGKRVLYYTTYKMGNPDIISQDLSTGARTVIARYSGLNTSPNLSPDGKRLAMILSKGGSPDLYVAAADGTNLRQLTNTKADESSPTWSPDGRKICFVSTMTGKRALFVISADGGEPVRLRTDGVLNPSEPDWSPDGKTIIFTSQMGGFSICKIPSVGGTATVLSEGEDPCFAGNSRTVIFTRRSNGKRSLSLLDVNTKRVKDIHQVSGRCSQPTWAR